MSTVRKRLQLKGDRFFENNQYSDLTIRCKDRVWHVSRECICYPGSFFEKACNGAFKEGKTGVIELHEENPNVIHSLILYLYTGGYPIPSSRLFGTDLPNKDPRSAIMTPSPFVGIGKTGANDKGKSPASHPPTDGLLMHVLVWKCADKYFLNEMKPLVESSFINGLQLYSPQEGFSAVIEAIYETAATEKTILRSEVTRVCAEQLTVVLNMRDVASAMKDIPEFSYDVLCKNNTHLTTELGNLRAAQSKCKCQPLSPQTSTPGLGLFGGVGSDTYQGSLFGAAPQSSRPVFGGTY